jgi:tetratricopeptide (TPR) repeat protein
MKVVHKNKEHVELKEGWALARQYESDDDPKAAIHIYRELLKQQPTNPRIYERLMILYRKTKESNKELEIINKAITVFERQFSKKMTPANTKVASLSNSLMKMTGLADRKGKAFYLPEPLAKWQRRKELLEKKMKKK